jgi:hypothetical protein
MFLEQQGATWSTLAKLFRPQIDGLQNQHFSAPSPLVERAGGEVMIKNRQALEARCRFER